MDNFEETQNDEATPTIITAAAACPATLSSESVTVFEGAVHVHGERLRAHAMFIRAIGVAGLLIMALTLRLYEPAKRRG